MQYHKLNVNPLTKAVTRNKTNITSIQDATLFIL